VSDTNDLRPVAVPGAEEDLRCLDRAMADMVGRLYQSYLYAAGMDAGLYGAGIAWGFRQSADRLATVVRADRAVRRAMLTLRA
jgi:hypothetical protein